MNCSHCYASVATHKSEKIKICRKEYQVQQMPFFMAFELSVIEVLYFTALRKLRHNPILFGKSDQRAPEYAVW
jgi:hypothetical protein